MRVNSTFKGFCNRSVALRPAITILSLVIFFVTSSFTDHPDRYSWAKQVNLMIRQIGHRLLLQAGDSTSRVLPVTEVKEGTFQLTFENELFFSHDSLILLSQDLLPKKQFPSGYTVTVHEGLKSDIVYGFQLNNTSPDITACVGRSQPFGRYTIEIAFPDLYKSIDLKPEVTQKKAEVVQLKEEPKPIKTEPTEVSPKPNEIKATVPQHDLVIKPAAAPSYSFVDIAITGTLVLLGVTLLVGGLGKIWKPATLKSAEFGSLGKFSFDMNGKRLQLGDEIITLTDKESRILELLHKNFGELVTRETLMEKIWINEGVITGRSLDMFVSKLRKKLSGDPDLRITNIHGKGYKLEVVM